MKKLLLSFLFSFFALGTVYAQELPHFKNLKLNKKSSYKNAEPMVGKVIDYLFNTPVDKKNKNRAEAGQFLTKWMNGTQDYTFYLEERETDLFSTDSDLLLMYMAALTKYTLQNPAEKNLQKITLGAIKLTLPYLNEKSDKRKWSKDLWSLYNNYTDGKLDKVYLK